MKTLFTGMLLSAMALGTASAETPKRPTIVLVHGAFADASSWNGVIDVLERDGYHVVATANPLRGVKSDASYVSAIVRNIAAPVVLVGHSYGGMVISAAAVGSANVKSLVYVAAFAPEEGESAAMLGGKFPGRTLGDALAPPVTLADGSVDLYLEQTKFPAQFAADVPLAVAKRMAATQRPIAKAAFAEPAPGAAWKTLPSWFIYGDADKNIPSQAHAFMAERAHAKDTVVVKGASHAVLVSSPEAVARVIEEAAK